MTAPRTDALIALLIALACFLPEVGLFGDAALLPKCYLMATAASLLGMKAVVRGADKRLVWKRLRQGLFAAAVGVCCWTMAEGMARGQWPVRGTFDNPAGMALSLCCVLALNSETPYGTEGWRRRLIIAGMAMMAMTVFATQSRIGLIALALLPVTNIRRHKGKAVLFLILAVTLSAGLSLSGAKSDSTSGRLFILQRTWDMVEEHPLTGWGAGGFRRNYMLKQAAHFADHPDDRASWLADDIRHPFCEYLLGWVDGGIAGLAICLVLFLFPVFRAKDRALRASCLTVAIFAIASYPSYYPISWLVLAAGWYSALRTDIPAWSHRLCIRVLCVAVCFTSVAITFLHAYTSFRLRQAETAAQQHQHRRALALYASLYTLNKHNPYYLYSYSRECYTIGLFDKALQLNDRCHRYWSCYDMTLLRADIMYQRHDFKAAEATYQLASQMCPVRFAPLEGLMNVYEATGDSVKLRLTAEQVTAKPIKVPSPSVNHIKCHAMEILLP